MPITRISGRKSTALFLIDKAFTLFFYDFHPNRQLQHYPSDSLRLKL